VKKKLKPNALWVCEDMEIKHPKKERLLGNAITFLSPNKAKETKSEIT